MSSAWKERKIIKFVLQLWISCANINFSVSSYTSRSESLFVKQMISKRMHDTSSLVYNQQWRLSCHKTVKNSVSAHFLEVLHDGRQVCVFKFSSENVERMKIENSIFIQILCIGYFWLISVIRTQQSVVHGNQQSRLNCAETRRTFDERRDWIENISPASCHSALTSAMCVEGDTGMCPHRDIYQISKHQVMTFVSILPGWSCWAAEGKCGETENLPLPRTLLRSKYINWNIWQLVQELNISIVPPPPLHPATLVYTQISSSFSPARSVPFPHSPLDDVYNKVRT